MTSSSQNLVQYVVLRRDLQHELGWPLGSIVAQACHASVAAVWDSRADTHTEAYCGPDNIDHMHKVVLEIKGREQLEKLASTLEEENVLHKLWLEQPENFPTCLATKPYPKGDIGHYFKKLKLCN